MPQTLNPEENFKILEKLPEDLRETMFSLDTADHIGNVCEKFKVPGEKISLVAKNVGDVLSKILPLEELQKTLEKDAGLKKEQAKNISDELNFRIFSQVRESLMSATVKNSQEEKKSSAAERPSRRSDAYREPVE